MNYRVFVGMLCLLFCFIETVHASGNSFGFEPYIGFGTSFLNMKGAKKQSFSNGTIDNLSKFQKKNFNTLDGYIGLKVMDYLGIEIGCQHSGTKKKSSNQDLTGVFAIAPPDSLNFQTELTFRNLYVDLNGFLPLNNCWTLTASVGVAHLDPILKYRAHRVVAAAMQDHCISVFDNVRKKNVLKVGLGAIYQFTERVSFRVKGEYLNSSKLRGTFNDTQDTARIFRDVKLFKDSYLLSLSIFTKLF